MAQMVTRVFSHQEGAQCMGGTTESCPLQVPNRKVGIHLLGSARCTGDHLGMSHSGVFLLGLSLPGLLATCSVQRGRP